MAYKAVIGEGVMAYKAVIGEWYCMGTMVK